MFALGQELVNKLKQLRVRVEIPDGDTLFLRNVPANNRFFNKARTNLLIKRPREGSPFLVCVDEDLQYTGSDSAVARAFAVAQRQQGWRVLLVDHESRRDGQDEVDRVTENALKVLGFDGDEPALHPAGNTMHLPLSGGIIGAFGLNLTERTDLGLAEQTIARIEQIENVIFCLDQRAIRLPVITGPSGIGKTNLLYGVARSLRQSPLSRELIAVDLGVMMAGTMFDSERENLLSTLLKEAAQLPELVLALEHVELALAGVPRGQWLLSQAVDNGARLIGTSLTAVPLVIAPLTRRVCVIELAELWPDELVAILSEHCPFIAEHHCVTIDENLFPLVIETSRRFEGHLPAKAIALLDAAASHARLSCARKVGIDDIHQSVSSFRLAVNEQHSASAGT